MNYSTDDPWSRLHRSRWLLAAIKEYDCVFSPRRSNLRQLRSLNGPIVHYLPFAYDPELHFAPKNDTEDFSDLKCDVLFVGGADSERRSMLGELVREGFDLVLYGGYWDRHALTRSAARGLAASETIRRATCAAKVSLCLVRRSNRDGHVMRSFEMAAIGACMLVEDTAEHRELFGDEGDAVLYFRTTVELIEKLRWLLDNPAKRRTLSLAARTRIANEHNTYSARLMRMLEAIPT